MHTKNRPYTHIEVLLWSIALPGFGQLINRKYVKGFVFIGLEFLINVQGHINKVIVSSFLGDIQGSIQETDYLWVMFYPCVYLFAIWDAYRDAGGGKRPFAFLPFVLSAYSGTIGVIYSSQFKINGYLLGPIFLSLLFMGIGFLLGLIVVQIIRKYMKAPLMIK